MNDCLVLHSSLECCAAAFTIGMDMEEKEQTHPPTRLISCADWPKYHPWPPIGGLRHLIFNAKKLGFEKVFKRVNRRILIDERKFFEFVEEKNLEKERKK